MVSFTGNIPPSSYSGTAIYCNNIDVSKLSKEERKEYLDKLSMVTYQGPNGFQGPNGGYYGPQYYMNNFGRDYKKQHVTQLTDGLIQSLDKNLESDNSSSRVDSASTIVRLFNEDPTRHNDKALNALLNKMLLNPYDINVRDYALTLLKTNMASGDENTKKVLEELKANPQQHRLIDRQRADIDSAELHMEEKTQVANVPV